MVIKTKKNRTLIEVIPEGVPISRSWLSEKGLSRHAIDNLLKSNQLDLLVRGVYIRNKARLTWQSIVYSMQQIMHIDVIIGSISALEIQGFHQYLSLSATRKIYVFSDAKPPHWANQVLHEVDFIWQNKHALINEKKYAEHQDKNLKNTLYEFEVKHVWREDLEGLLLSCPEKAILEVMLDVPNKITFEHANQLMQGLTSLSPNKVQKLLEVSTNIKVKRLFLWLASKLNYGWYKKIDESKVNLGSGKRVIERNGIFDKKYKITVPATI